MSKYPLRDIAIAWMDGTTIQFRQKSGEYMNCPIHPWQDYPDFHTLDQPLFPKPLYEWRIKPEFRVVTKWVAINEALPDGCSVYTSKQLAEQWGDAPIEIRIIMEGGKVLGIDVISNEVCRTR